MHMRMQNLSIILTLLPRMFLSRTVAGEVCMEAKSNESAYRALKSLDRAGDLLFSLPYCFISSLYYV